MTNRRIFTLLAGSCLTVVLLTACGTSTPQLSQAQPQAMASGCDVGDAQHARCNVFFPRGEAGTKPMGLSPHDLQSAYKLPSKTKGAGQIVAVIDAYDNPNAASDMATYRSKFNLPAGTLVKYNQQGEQGNYPQASTSWGVEIDLNVEMVSASCPRCTIYLVEANSNSVTDLETAVAEAVSLGAHIVSTSWTARSLKKSYFDSRGVTYLGASGASVPAYPADFDSVVAVGGTNLMRDAKVQRGWIESASTASDGGCVTSQVKPAWQHDTYCTHRLANDVSAVAASAVAEYDSYGYGGWFQIGGTSVSTPLVAGVFGLAANAQNQDGGRTFWLKAHQKYLFKVSGGSGCAYSKGRYNTCSGWGSPDGIGAF